MIAALSRNWWLITLRGVFAILFGIMAFVWPGLSIVSLTILFGAYALVDGVAAIVIGIMARHQEERWWVIVVQGVAGVIFGILTLLWPGMTAILLVYMIGFWSIVIGVLGIIAAIRLRKEIDNEWWLGLSGALSVFVGLIMIAMPGAGALALIWLIGAYAILYGITLIALSFRLRDRAARA